ncbi:MAG: Crp/Fnr family transcriptional regulator [Bacteroidaceae bacterium]|nr:Crp/Fnr family transcriptional regulator [Bacteroidaceae bacterium]
MNQTIEIASSFSNNYYPLTQEGIGKLVGIMESQKLAKGEVFVKEGEIAHYLYYIEKGMVRQFYFKNKRDLTEHISYEGNVVICLESYLKQEPTRLMAETLEPTIIWKIAWEDINRLAEESKEIGLFYRKIFEESLLVSQMKADNMRFETAQDRYKKFMELHPEIIKRAPLVYIASYLQMTPETLSRVRASIL